MKGRVLDVNGRKTSSNKDIFDVNVETEGKTTKYQCWDLAIKDMSGKEIEFTVKESANPAFPTPTLMLPKGDGNTFQKKTWTGGGKQAFDPNTMILSYAKDLIVAMMEHSKNEHTPVGIANATVAIYRVFKAELAEKPVTPEQVAKAVGGKVVNDGEIPF